MINSNLPYLYLAPYPGYEIICHIFASDSRVLHFNALAGGDPCEYRHKWYVAENKILRATFQLQNVSLYLQALLRNGLQKLPSLAK